MLSPAMKSAASILGIAITSCFFSPSVTRAGPLRIEHDVATGTIQVFRHGGEEPILTQNARPDFRPYIHPIVAPDGNDWALWIEKETR